jgi:hypothetical protein
MWVRLKTHQDELSSESKCWRGKTSKIRKYRKCWTLTEIAGIFLMLHLLLVNACQMEADVSFCIVVEHKIIKIDEKIVLFLSKY